MKKEDFVKFATTKNGKINPQIRYLLAKSENLIYLNFLNENSSHLETSNILEKVYCYTQNIVEIPKCKICGKQLTYKGGSKPYPVYCCKKCIFSDKEYLKKISFQNNMIKKHGVSNCSFIPEINRKRKETNVERCGFEVPIQSKAISDKIKNTKQQRYNDPYYNNRIKYKNTCISLYNKESSNQDETIKRKQKIARIESGSWANVTNRNDFSNYRKTVACLSEILVRKYPLAGKENQDISETI